jgi:hypothetical protein
MYNAKKKKNVLEVQYGKITASIVQYGKNNVRSHVLNGCFLIGLKLKLYNNNIM